MNILNKILIGYVPYSNELNAPGDRRRFIFFANELKINYEIIRIELINEIKRYDIIYLTYGANLSFWIKYKKKYPHTKIIFELIDSYLFENYSMRSIFRGLFRFIFGKENYLWLNKKTI